MGGATSSYATLAATLAGCGDGALDGAEMRAALSGNSAQGLTADQQPYTVFFAPSGMIHMEVANGYVDRGRWWITANDQYCRSWSRIDGGQEACFAVSRAGDELTFARGESRLVVTLVTGNPEQLPKIR